MNKPGKMIRNMSLLALAGVIVLGSLACTRPQSPVAYAQTGVLGQFQQTGIRVNGVGEVMAGPDVVQLSLGVEAQAATVAQAQQKAREAMDRIMDVLTTKRVAEKDIQTQSFRIDQVTRFDPRTNNVEVLGYRVSNIVSAKIRKISEAGQIIDAVAEAGGDLTRIHGINFTVDNPRPLFVQVRDKAMQDAIAKAEQLAKGGNVRLGAPVLISESSFSMPPPRPVMPMAMARAEGAPATDISPGELKISLTVEVHFSID